MPESRTAIPGASAAGAVYGPKLEDGRFERLLHVLVDLGRSVDHAYPLHVGSGLAINALVREGFYKALQSEVVVPRLGETLVLLVK